MGRPLVGHTYVVKNTYVELNSYSEEGLVKWSQDRSTSETTAQDLPESSCPSPPTPLEQVDLMPAATSELPMGEEPFNLAVLATPSPFLYPATPLELPQDYDGACSMMLPPAFDGDGMIPFEMMGFDTMGMPFPGVPPMMYDASTDMYVPCGFMPMDFEGTGAVDPSFLPVVPEGVEGMGEVAGPEAAASPDGMLPMMDEGGGCEQLAVAPPAGDDSGWSACEVAPASAGEEVGNWPPAEGSWSQAPAEGSWSQAPAEGSWSQAPAEGNWSQAPAEGNWSRAPAEGNWAEVDPKGFGGTSQVQDDDSGDAGASSSIWSGCGTTVMLRNIPNKYTRDMLVAQLNEDLRGQFDFVYLPIDFKNRCNVGYCFINFRSIEVREQFVEAFDGVEVRKCLPGLNSKKVAEVAPARVHGLEDNVKRLRNSPVMNELIGHPEWMPLVFDEDGRDCPFPLPDQPVPAMKPRSRRRQELGEAEAAAGPQKGSHGRKDSGGGRPWKGGHSHSGQLW